VSVLTAGGRRPSPAPQQVAPGVYLVTLGRGVVSSNVYLVRSDSAWTLVDAGWATSAGAIRTAAEAVFGPGTAPAVILLTHLHPDHSGAAGTLARSWAVPVYVHPDELPMAAGRYLPQYAMPLDRWLVVPLMRLLPTRIRGRIEAAGSITDVVAPLDRQGGVPGLPDWAWVSTPGHTPGHVAYLRPSDGVLLAGDAALTVDLNTVGGVLVGRRRVAGPPRYTTWDWPAAQRSIRALADLEPRVLAPGHGRPLSVGTAAALAALAQGRPRGHRRRGLQDLVPRYSASGRYRPPPRWYARLQWLGFALSWLGLSPNYVVTLEVPGRRSGMIRRTNLVLLAHDGQRYLVALAGESEWVRNARAAGGRVVLGRRRQRRGVTLVEVPAPDRAPIIRAYMLRAGRQPGSAQVAREAGIYFGVSGDPTLAEIGRVADRYPVFRVAPWPSPNASTVRHGEERKAMSALTYRTETLIRRPPEDVFDFCSDLRSELRWNPNAKYVEKLTDGPVGVGTRYRAQWANSGPTTVEVTQFDRPYRWETTATARGMSIRFQGTVTDAAPGARYTADLELHPKGLARLVAPLALVAMRRQDQQHMHRIREALESSAVPSD
jgi:glyoxylase-like metal-dependent hydrolase (beta-lactamase superfamily II)